MPRPRTWRASQAKACWIERRQLSRLSRWTGYDPPCQYNRRRVAAMTAINLRVFAWRDQLSHRVQQKLVARAPRTCPCIDSLAPNRTATPQHFSPATRKPLVWKARNTYGSPPMDYLLVKAGR